MQRSKIDFWVGLFVLLGGAALLFLALKAGNLLTFDTRSGYRVQALFQDIGGLKPNAAVKSSGVLVGRVKGIEFDDKTYQARVLLDFDQRFHFPNDSTLKIMTSGLLGDQYIGVEAGYSDTNWKAGDVVKNTQSAVVLENLIGQIINSKALDSASGGSAGSGGDTGGADSAAAAVSAPASAPAAAGKKGARS